MSYQVGQACYSDFAVAAAAVASAESGTVVPAGSVVYVVDAAADALGSITYTFSDVSGGVTPMVYAQAPSLPECGLLTAADAGTMGWGVAAAWLCAWALLCLRKGF